MVASLLLIHLPKKTILCSGFELGPPVWKALQKQNAFLQARTRAAHAQAMDMYHGLKSSVADPGCFFRIPDPNFYPSGIPDPGSRISDPGSRTPDPRSRIQDHGSRIPHPGSKNSNKREGWRKKFVVISFFVATNLTKLKIIFILKCWIKKFGPVFKEL